MNTYTLKRKRQIIIAISLIMAITLTAFLPVLKNGFTTWDDEGYITANPAIRSLSRANLKYIFSSFFIANYQPLSIFSYCLEYRFFKLNPLAYHLTNLILHLFNALLVFWLVLVLVRKISSSFIAALLFGIHPLHVESVAWASERKDVLCAFFFLLAAISYCYYLRKNRSLRFYDFALLSFVLALLSKAMAMTLPAVLFLIDYIFGRKPRRSMFLDKIPFFIVSFLFGAAAVFAQYTSGAVRQETYFNFLDKIMIASYGIVFYLQKLFMPVRLSCLYPYPFKTGNFLPAAFLFSPLIIIILCLAVAVSLRHTRKAAFGMGLFLFTLLPVLQFVPLGSVIVADRYAYIPSIGICFIAAEAVTWIYGHKIRYNRTAIVISAFFFAALIGVLSVLTWNRCKVWKDNFTLWDDAVNNYPEDPVPYLYRGMTYARRNEDKKAISDLTRNLDLYYEKSGIPQGYSGIANKPCVTDSDYSQAYNLFGMRYVRLGGPFIYFAVSLFEKAIEMDPANVQAYCNCAAAYGTQQRYPQAIKMAEKAIEINPRSGNAHYNLAVAYFFNQQYEPASWHLNIAMNLGFPPDPEFLKLAQDKGLLKK